MGKATGRPSSKPSWLVLSLGLLACALAFVLAGCGAKETTKNEDLIGTWVSCDVEKLVGDGNPDTSFTTGSNWQGWTNEDPVEIDLAADGTGEVRICGAVMPIAHWELTDGQSAEGDPVVELTISDTVEGEIDVDVLERSALIRTTYDCLLDGSASASLRESGTLRVEMPTEAGAYRIFFEKAEGQ